MNSHDNHHDNHDDNSAGSDIMGLLAEANPAIADPNSTNTAEAEALFSQITTDQTTSSIGERTKLGAAHAPRRSTRLLNAAAVSLLALLVGAAVFASSGGGDTPAEVIVAAAERTSGFDSGRVEFEVKVDAEGFTLELGAVSMFNGDDAEVSLAVQYPEGSLFDELNGSTTTRYVDGRIYRQGDFSDTLEIDSTPSESGANVWTDLGPVNELGWASLLSGGEINRESQDTAALASSSTALIDVMVTADDFEHDGDNGYSATLNAEQIETLAASPGTSFMFGTESSTSYSDNGITTTKGTSSLEEARLELTTSEDDVIEEIVVEYFDEDLGGDVTTYFRLSQLGEVGPIEVPGNVLPWSAAESNYAKASKAEWESLVLLGQLDVCQDLDDAERIDCLIEAGEIEAAEAIQAKVAAEALVTDEEREKYDPTFDAALDAQLDAYLEVADEFHEITADLDICVLHQKPDKAKCFEDAGEFEAAAAARAYSDALDELNAASEEMEGFPTGSESNPN